MKRMLLIALCCAAPLATLATGCDDDSGSTAMDMATSGNPAAPKVGAQIDRMGRPAVNTALTNPFGLVPNTTIDAFKDAYNAEASPTMWQSKFMTAIETNLAVLDSADT